jgi:hypothetical protein
MTTLGLGGAIALKAKANISLQTCRVSFNLLRDGGGQMGPVWRGACGEFPAGMTKKSKGETRGFFAALRMTTERAVGYLGMPVSKRR